MKKNYIYIFVFFYFNFSCITLFAQQYEDFGFQRDLSIIVNDSLSNKLKDPWGGGLNSCQFSQIDLNQDGIKDLFVYDKNSDRILTFINNGTADSVDYTYAPEYIDIFKSLFNYVVPTQEWIMLYDYNNDGKEDIFTYLNGGIAVYKNISDHINGLKFSLVTNQIQSLQGTTLTNLFLTYNDSPALADIDNDGDMDIIAKYVMGTYYEYHKNMSMEKYGTPDSLDFVEVETCWGKFSEDASSNKITLGIDSTSCPNGDTKSILNSTNILTNGAKHVGGTILATDLNSDGVKDLLLGDTGFPGLIKLTNGGTIYESNMISEDTMFPSNSKKTNLFSMPVSSFLDVDNDGIKDLIVSPFDAAQTVSENLKSCWYYKNTGTNSSPIFEFKYDNFLQKDMIDVGAGAYPVLYDYDGDGLLDLFIGNYGTLDSTYYSYGILNSTYVSRITLYKNIGTNASPMFQFVTNDFANISSRKLTGVIPTFGDIDGDGIPEMIIGRSDGYLDLYKNTAPVGKPINMVLSQAKYMNIHVGHPALQDNPSSAPQLIDLDGDSLLDLVIGERNGNIEFYKNTGTKTNPVFSSTPTNDTLGGVLITKKTISNYGYSVPCFFKDSTNHFKLFLGSESGYIYYYKDIENNLSSGKHFTLVDSMYLNINEGGRSGITVGNLNNDNYPDMLIGNFSGGLSYFKGIHPNYVYVNEYYPNNFINVESYPNPTNDKLFIKFPKNININNLNFNIYNIMGKSVICKNKNNGSLLSLDVSAFAEGLYFYSISGYDINSKKDFSSKGKFIVVH